MNIGDTIIIKNVVGILRVRIEKELSIRDINRCIGDDKLPSFEYPRLEYHVTAGDEKLITLCERKLTPPFNMYLMHFDPFEDKPKCYLGMCDTNEDPIFETIC